MSFKYLSAAICLCLLLVSVSSAEVPKMINYQGKLTTPDGALIDTSISMIFAIYTDSIGTDSVWSETQSSVVVEKGIFSVLLGSVNPIPDSVFTGDIRYLAVKAGDDPEMTPRKAIVSVAYAYNSDKVDGMNSSTFVQITGDQNVSGVKSFEDIPILPSQDPTNDNHSVRKAYVDSKTEHLWTHSGAQVFDGYGPIGWSDMDLSSYVGSNRALVMLRVLAPGPHTTKALFRTKGDNYELGGISDQPYGAGISGADLGVGNQSYLIIETDSNGYIQWKAVIPNLVKVWLVGFIK